MLLRRRVRAPTDVVDALGDKRLVIMKNHGTIVVSNTVEKTVVLAITLGRAARFHLECVAAGGTEILEAEVRGGRAMHAKHYLPQVWRANLDRIPRTDPDLFAVLGPDA